MHSWRVPTVATIAAILLLTGCTSPPSVDPAAGRAWLDEVTADESDGPGAAGTGAFGIGPDDAAGHLRLDFDEPIVVTSVDARCFDGDGGIVATVSVSVTTEAGDDSVEREIPCDRAAHTIELDAAAATGVRLRATAPTQTFMHVSVIRELVVERG